MGAPLVRLSPLDARLLRGLLRGLSVKELAAELGAPTEWVKERSKLILDTAATAHLSGHPLPVVAHPRLSALLHLWDVRRARRALPAHGVLRVTDLQPWMAHIAVMEMAASPPQPKVRLMGRKLIEYMRGDKSGQYAVDYIPEHSHIQALAPFRRIVEQRLPQYDVLTPSLPGWEHLRYHRLLLPHSRDGRRVDIVILTTYLEADEEVRQPPYSFYELRPRRSG